MKQMIFLSIAVIIGKTSFCQQNQHKNFVAPLVKIDSANRGASQRSMSPMNYPVIYTFIGNGNWSDPKNWDANGVPPQPTSPGSQILINSQIAGAKCILDIPYSVQNGTISSKLIIYTGNNLVVPGTFTVK
jgi:hypothetical protein